MMPTAVRSAQGGEGPAASPQGFGAGSWECNGAKPSQCREAADFLQGFANPLRVEILCVLRDGEKSAGEITRRVGAKKANISLQLRVLTDKGYLARRRDERNVYYRVRDPEIFEVLEYILHLVCRSGSSG